MRLLSSLASVRVLFYLSVPHRHFSSSKLWEKGFHFLIDFFDYLSFAQHFLEFWILKPYPSNSKNQVGL